SLIATADLAGTLDLSAYAFGSDARPAGDHRLVFVQPADELKVEATADAQVYKPGGDARIQFRVTNGRGEGVQAALGLQVVDEAVFALAEKQPGFAKVFFYLEQEVMKPRYEIHSIGMPEVVEPVEKARVEQRDRAARALFSATEMVNRNKFETVLGRSVPMDKWGEYWNRYRQHFVQQVTTGSKGLMACLGGCDAVKDLRDSWGTSLRVERTNFGQQNTYYMIRSAGPDKRFNTGDDLASYFELRTQRVVGPPTAGVIDLQMEHDRGPYNGLAEVAGSVKDQAGVPVPSATLTVRETATGKERTAKTNAAGQFSLAGLAPGSYELRVSSPGFQIPSSTLALKERDRAVISATLTVGIMEQRVFVSTGGIRVGGMVQRQMVQQGQQGMQRDMVVGGVAGGAPGGVLGGIIGGVPAAMPPPPPPMAMAAPMARMENAPMALKDVKTMNSMSVLKKEDGGVAAAPHVRSYFPEALYIDPEIITDRDGRASISIPLADSITTWRMAMMASTAHGALGSATSSLKVFQDFFVDLDMPVTLTQGDRVSIPVAVYNYSGTNGNVALQLHADDWFSLVEDVAEKNLAVESGRVGGSQFTLEAKRIGKFKLTLAARMTGGGTGATRGADIVVREIEVIPNGREQTQVFNGRLESSVRHDVNFPSVAIPDAGKIFVRLYPGPLSQVIEGMDSILRMPGGCFEQTSSSTYPNVLALDYMKRTKKLTPEVHAKAEGYIANGYQRLLTFEVPGGGFSWFGSAPANKILTAYGLMEFSDMSKVSDVDAKLIQRTQAWLAAQQLADGSWKPDTAFINEGATNRFNSDVLRITAYLGWSLGNT
ncbi:MAG TPA: alpha-2-macroglobulin family protein, partial [Bryobacteraceae bacterium]